MLVSVILLLLLRLPIFFKHIFCLFLLLLWYFTTTNATYNTTTYMYFGWAAARCFYFIKMLSSHIKTKTFHLVQMNKFFTAWTSIWFSWDTSHLLRTQGQSNAYAFGGLTLFLFFCWSFIIAYYQFNCNSVCSSSMESETWEKNRSKKLKLYTVALFEIQS